MVSRAFAKKKRKNPTLHTVKWKSLFILVLFPEKGQDVIPKFKDCQGVCFMHMVNFRQN